MNGRDLIEVDQFLSHPPERVWRALTDPALLARWLMPNNFKAQPGYRFTLDAGRYGRTDCQVLDIEPERLIRFSWRNDTLDTTVTWRLEPEGNGTRLFITHAGFDPQDTSQRAAFDAMLSGWRGPILAALQRVLESRE
jgi:uncharacterized protein YndB with AHSA1/START domain